MTLEKISPSKKYSLLKKLRERRKRANKEGKIDNSTLYAGSPMYYYCGVCGLQSDKLPEEWDPRVTTPKKICDDCKPLKDLGLLK